MSEDLDINLDFLDDDAGLLDTPTMRGNANLDVQDYQRLPGVPDSSFLDDELQEDVLSTPGSGAGPAPDVDGMSEFDLIPGSPDEQIGSYPWRVGGGGGYRPSSMRTDLSGDEMTPEQEIAVRAPNNAQPVHRASNRQTNSMPSNRGVDPETLIDRDSFEYSDDPQNVIGTGIFDDEEGVVWNAKEGIFANNYSLPAYIAQEGQLDVQQSQMWDSVANNWRVVQPSGGGVTFSRRVPALKPTSNPAADQQMPNMHVDKTGPRSHIEAFGRAAAKAVVDEARMIRDPGARSAFLMRAAEALGPGQASRCRQVADRLVAMGWRPDTALEDTFAHCVMHATVKDISDRSRGSRRLDRIDRMSANVRANSEAIRQAVVEHVVPVVANNESAKADVSALVASPAAAGMGQVATNEAPASNTGRNLLIGAAALGVGYLLLTKTDHGRAVQRNIKRHARKLARTMGVK